MSSIAAFDVTFDPLDPKLLVLHLVWLVVGGALMGVAFKAKTEWVRAGLAAMGMSILGIWLLAILPSWWLYYADGRLKWGGQGCAVIDLQCLKQTLKDLLVVVENGAVLVALVVGFLFWQRKFPKQLAPGESKPESGGYK